MNYIGKTILRKVFEQYLNLEDNQLDLDFNLGTTLKLPSGTINHQKINQKIQPLGLRIKNSTYKNLSISIPLTEISSKPIKISIEKFYLTVIRISKQKDSEYQQRQEKGQSQKTKDSQKQNADSKGSYGQKKQPKSKQQQKKQEEQTTKNDSSDGGYIKNMVNRLLYNMEILIEHVEMIMEGQDSNSGSHIGDLEESQQKRFQSRQSTSHQKIQRQSLYQTEQQPHSKKAEKLHELRFEIKNFHLRNSLVILQADIVKKICNLEQLIVQHKYCQLIVKDLNVSLDYNNKKLSVIAILDCLKFNLYGNKLSECIEDIERYFLIKEEKKGSESAKAATDNGKAEGNIQQKQKQNQKAINSAHERVKSVPKKSKSIELSIYLKLLSSEVSIDEWLRLKGDQFEVKLNKRSENQSIQQSAQSSGISQVVLLKQILQVEFLFKRIALSAFHTENKPSSLGNSRKVENFLSPTYDLISIEYLPFCKQVKIYSEYEDNIIKSSLFRISSSNTQQKNSNLKSSTPSVLRELDVQLSYVNIFLNYDSIVKFVQQNFLNQSMGVQNPRSSNKNTVIQKILQLYKKQFDKDQRSDIINQQLQTQSNSKPHGFNSRFAKHSRTSINFLCYRFMINAEIERKKCKIFGSFKGQVDLDLSKFNQKLNRQGLHYNLSKKSISESEINDHRPTKKQKQLPSQRDSPTNKRKLTSNQKGQENKISVFTEENKTMVSLQIIQLSCSVDEKYNLLNVGKLNMQFTQEKTDYSSCERIHEETFPRKVKREVIVSATQLTSEVSVRFVKGLVQTVDRVKIQIQSLKDKILERYGEILQLDRRQNQQDKPEIGKGKNSQVTHAQNINVFVQLNQIQVKLGDLYQITKSANSSSDQHLQEHRSKHEQVESKFIWLISLQGENVSFCLKNSSFFSRFELSIALCTPYTLEQKSLLKVPLNLQIEYQGNLGHSEKQLSVDFKNNLEVADIREQDIQILIKYFSQQLSELQNKNRDKERQKVKTQCDHDGLQKFDQQPSSIFCRFYNTTNQKVAFHQEVWGPNSSNNYNDEYSSFGDEDLIVDNNAIKRTFTQSKQYRAETKKYLFSREEGLNKSFEFEAYGSGNIFWLNDASFCLKLFLYVGKDQIKSRQKVKKNTEQFVCGQSEDYILLTSDPIFLDDLSVARIPSDHLPSDLQKHHYEEDVYFSEPSAEQLQQLKTPWDQISSRVNNRFNISFVLNQFKRLEQIVFKYNCCFVALSGNNYTLTRQPSIQQPSQQTITIAPTSVLLDKSQFSVRQNVPEQRHGNLLREKLKSMSFLQDLIQQSAARCQNSLNSRRLKSDFYDSLLSNSSYQIDYEMLLDLHEDVSSFTLKRQKSSHLKNQQEEGQELFKLQNLTASSKYSLYGVYKVSPTGLSVGEKLANSPQTLKRYEYYIYEHYHHNLQEQYKGASPSSLDGSLGHHSKDTNGSFTNHFIMMPFILVENSLGYDIELKVTDKKTQKSSRYLIQYNSNDTDGGNHKNITQLKPTKDFDFYNKQFTLQFSLLSQNYEDPSEKQVIYSSEDHYFNTFFMVEHNFETCIELTNQKSNNQSHSHGISSSKYNDKKYIFVREELILKTKYIRLENALQIVNMTQYDFGIRFKTLHPNFIDLEKAKRMSTYTLINEEVDNRHLLIEKGYRIQYPASMKKQSDTIEFLYENLEETHIAVKANLLKNNNFCVLSFNFVNIQSSEKDLLRSSTKKISSGGLKKGEKYSHLLFRVRIEQNDSGRQFIFLQNFITLTNLTKSPLSTTGIQIPPNGEICYPLPPTTNQKYNNKLLFLTSVELQKLYDDLFLVPLKSHSQKLIGNDHRETHSQYENFPLILIENKYVSFEQMLINTTKQLKLRQSHNHGYKILSLLKDISKNCIRFFLSEDIYNPQVNYTIFENRTQLNFLLNKSKDDDYAHHFVGSKDDAEQDSISSDSESSEENFVELKEEEKKLSQKGQSSNKNIQKRQQRDRGKNHRKIIIETDSLNIMANKQSYEVLISDKEGKHLQKATKQNLQKYHISMEEHLTGNFSYIYIRYLKRPSFKDQKISALKNPQNSIKISLKTRNIELKVSLYQKLQLSLMIKNLTFRVLDQNKIDILIQDISITDLQNNQHILRIPEQSYILSERQSLGGKFYLRPNLYVKFKHVIVNIKKQLLYNVSSLMGYFQQNFNTNSDSKAVLESEQKLHLQNKVGVEKNEALTKLKSYLKQEMYLIKKVYVHEIHLSMSIDIEGTNFSTVCVLPEYELTNSFMRQSSYEKQILEFYKTNILAKLPKLSFLFQTLKNPLSMLKGFVKFGNAFKEQLTHIPHIICFGDEQDLEFDEGTSKNRGLLVNFSVQRWNLILNKFFSFKKDKQNGQSDEQMLSYIENNGTFYIVSNEYFIILTDNLEKEQFEIESQDERLMEKRQKSLKDQNSMANSLEKQQQEQKGKLHQCENHSIPRGAWIRMFEANSRASSNDHNQQYSDYYDTDDVPLKDNRLTGDIFLKVFELKDLEKIKVIKNNRNSELVLQFKVRQQGFKGKNNLDSSSEPMTQNTLINIVDSHSKCMKIVNAINELVM